MSVVLGGEELIFWCERAVDLANVECAPVGSGNQIHVFRQVGERHERLAFGESRKSPFRYTEDTQSRQCQAAFENIPTRGLVRHGPLLLLDVRLLDVRELYCRGFR